MIKAENAKKLAEDYLKNRELELIKRTEEYLEGTIARCIKAEAEKGISAIVVFLSDTLDKKYFINVLEKKRIHLRNKRQRFNQNQLVNSSPERVKKNLDVVRLKMGIDFLRILLYNYIKIKNGVIKMINIRTLKKLANNDGLTLKNGKIINYKSGWQVATEGIETTDIVEAMKAVKAYNGNCGIWFSEGVWYIDKSRRVSTKREALELGRACNQISILKWATMGLVYC